MTARSLQGHKRAAKRRVLNSVKGGESKEKETLLCRGQQSTTVRSLQRRKNAEWKAGAETSHQMLGCRRKAITIWQHLGSDTGQPHLLAQQNSCSSSMWGRGQILLCLSHCSTGCEMDGPREGVAIALKSFLYISPMLPEKAFSWLLRWCLLPQDVVSTGSGA